MNREAIAGFRGRLVYGGLMGFALSLVVAEYFSQGLLARYQAWSFWRATFGSDPNAVTSIVSKITWAFFFLISWLMLWRLDRFWLRKSPDGKTVEGEKPPVQPSGERRDARGKAAPEPEEENEEDEKGTSQSGPEGKEETSSASVRADPPGDPEEQRFAKVLGLEQPFDLAQLKSAHRTLIAQYHPDRVSAMGPEIREVAEIKAKEINEAYEYFRKKFGEKE